MASSFIVPSGFNVLFGTFTSKTSPFGASTSTFPPFGTVTEPSDSTSIDAFPPIVVPVFLTTFPFGSSIPLSGDNTTPPSVSTGVSLSGETVIFVLSSVAENVFPPISTESFSFSVVITVCVVPFSVVSFFTIVEPVLVESVFMIVLSSLPSSVVPLSITRSYSVPAPISTSVSVV